MGLFDRGYTRRGIRKALRMSWRRRFSHAPPNSTQSRCAAIVAVAARLPRRARPAIRQTPYLPAEKKGELRADGAPPIVRVIGSWRPFAQSDSFASRRKSRADQDDGYVRKKPWVSSLRGVLLVLFCRHGQKSTFIQQTVKLQFIISILIILENPSKSKREAQFSRFLCKKI